MPLTDDPIADFNAYEAERLAWLKSTPKCIHCKDPLGDGEAYFIEDKWVCECCISRYKRKVK